MKCTIPEISWHNRDPVLSIDIQRKLDDKNEFYRLATGGTDSHVLIWYLTESEDGRVHPTIAADLARHQKAVNVVRWSPSGEYLASGDDESVIFIWKLKSESETINILDTTNEHDKEIWITYKILRGHMEDVYDLSWSPDSASLISASVDNTAMVWDVLKGKAQCILSDHKNFVQGVAWDPKNQFLVTLSTDRYMRTYDVTSKKLLHQSGKCALPVPTDSPLSGKVIRLFHDETLQTFYRRLCFSPDGKLIIAPSGVAELNGDNSKPIHTTYIYTRSDQKAPAIVLPSPDQFTIAARCCPLLFELRDFEESNPPIIDLPYRIVFAVATKSSVCLYDTQQKMPFGLISNIHYARLTDLAWSSDGKVLIVSSSDGFCTLITFSDNELGTIYTEKGKIGEPMEFQEETKNDDVSGFSKISTTNETKSNPTARVVNELVTKFNLTPPKDKILKIPSNIIEVDDKFEDSEPKDKVATPIHVRRQPRCSSNTPGNQEKPTEERKTPNSKKQPTPIAVRRQPRIIFESGPENVVSSTAQDDALDAWPIDEPNSKGAKKDESIKPKSQVITTNCAGIVEATEDIRLVYDDSSLDSTMEEEVKVTPSSKGARRVELRTISTPKSNKKLF
ncbi:Chromatin assembly factor 1 subunit B [Pseudolycoriella hygida]|uniref:Chromatin assembly factor 1 subunit B n=1 Tax=Pseudolycoriella hygida TaxID=35572 RepID=A0A9Q0N2J5_9DIPT|nr:Chromatin assembly factor 1 subunit B [Pseudolycoriella hygida]